MSERAELGVQGPERLAAAERLRTFVRATRSGGCLLFSKGAACECPLCDIDRLVSLPDSGDAPREPSERALQAAVDSFAFRDTSRIFAGKGVAWVPHHIVDAVRAAYAVDGVASAPDAPRAPTVTDPEWKELLRAALGSAHKGDTT